MRERRVLGVSASESKLHDQPHGREGLVWRRAAAGSDRGGLTRRSTERSGAKGRCWVDPQ